MLWWLGDVREVVYEDDAMGGVEANCLLRLRMVNGARGVVQLSRDWPLPNRYVIECEKGWLTYTCDVVDRIEWGLQESDYGLDAQIRRLAKPSREAQRQLSGRVTPFMDCFADQLRNAVAAAQGKQSVKVPGKDARKTVALIEHCYRTRRLLPMAWLDEIEVIKATELAHV
jgi:hypothetical protein